MKNLRSYMLWFSHKQNFIFDTRHVGTPELRIEVSVHLDEMKFIFWNLVDEVRNEVRAFRPPETFRYPKALK